MNKVLKIKLREECIDIYENSILISSVIIEVLKNRGMLKLN